MFLRSTLRPYLIDVKILIINEVTNNFSTFISCVVIPYSGVSYSRYRRVLSLYCSSGGHQRCMQRPYKTINSQLLTKTRNYGKISNVFSSTAS